MSIVKSAQLLNVGRCEGGLPMATFERLEPYVGKPTSTVLMGLGSGNGPWLPDQCCKCHEADDYWKNNHRTRLILSCLKSRVTQHGEDALSHSGMRKTLAFILMFIEAVPIPSPAISQL